MTRPAYKIHLTEAEIDVINFCLKSYVDSLEKMTPEFPDEVENFTLAIVKANNLIHRISISKDTQDNA